MKQFGFAFKDQEEQEEEVAATLSKMSLSKKVPKDEQVGLASKLCWVHDDGTARVWGYFESHDSERRYEVEFILSYGIDSNALEFKLINNDKTCQVSYPPPALFLKTIDSPIPSLVLNTKKVPGAKVT